MKDSSGLCDMCGHQVAMRQRAHIVAEGPKKGANLMMLCPSCHLMFDTHLKPKMCKALRDYGVSGLPPSWEMSIFEVAGKKAAAAMKAKK